MFMINSIVVLREDLHVFLVVTWECVALALAGFDCNPRHDLRYLKGL